MYKKRRLIYRLACRLDVETEILSRRSARGTVQRHQSQLLCICDIYEARKWDASKFCGHYIHLTIGMAYLMRVHGTDTLKMSPRRGTNQPTSTEWFWASCKGEKVHPRCRVESSIVETAPTEGHWRNSIWSLKWAIQFDGKKWWPTYGHWLIRPKIDW